jgi:predicted N-formylglutamate amidohydrolase
MHWPTGYFQFTEAYLPFFSDNTMTQYTPFHYVDRSSANDLVVLCDHAANTIPPIVPNGNLGLSAEDMARHIAYDVGAAGVSLALGRHLNASVLMSNFSRLVIDPNRGEDDPTLVMRLYDGSIIPANRHLTPEEKELRLNTCYRPYHHKIALELAAREHPILISIHSFARQLRGREKRPWHIGVLYSDDARMARPFINTVLQDKDICLGDNQPYSGNLPGDCLDRHAVQDGLYHVLIELRNDLIEAQEQQEFWAEKLAHYLQDAIAVAKRGTRRK